MELQILLKPVMENLNTRETKTGRSTYWRVTQALEACFKDNKNKNLQNSFLDFKTYSKAISNENYMGLTQTDIRLVEQSAHR